MWWIGFLGVLGVWVASVESCRLSSEQPNSWVVSVRKIKTEVILEFHDFFGSGQELPSRVGRLSSKIGHLGHLAIVGQIDTNLGSSTPDEDLIACVGTLIAKNYVVAPMTCFQENPGEGFHKGRDYIAAAGEHKFDSCHQMRKGVLIMGHPKMAEDKFTYNIAYLEVEPFDVNPEKPPYPRLPKSEKFNVKFLMALMNDKANCQFLWFKSDYEGNDSMKNSVEAVDVSMMTRSRCWDTYCPSGNRGCVAYFWTSDTYVCSAYAKPKNRDNTCKWASVGAPLVCNGTAVGMLKSCYRDRPLMTQGFNKHQIRGIKLYQRIASGEEEVEPNGEEQKEPDFPKEDTEDTDLWRLD